MGKFLPLESSDSSIQTFGTEGAGSCANLLGGKSHRMRDLIDQVFMYTESGFPIHSYTLTAIAVFEYSLYLFHCSLKTTIPTILFILVFQ